MKVRVKKKVPVRIRIDKARIAKISPGVDVVSLDVLDDGWDYHFSDAELGFDYNIGQSEAETLPEPSARTVSVMPSKAPSNTLPEVEPKTSAADTMPAVADTLVYMQNRGKLAEWGTPLVVMFLVVAIFVGAGIKYRTDYMFQQYEKQREMLADVREQEQQAADEADRLEREAREAAEEAAKAAEEEEHFVYREDGVVDLLKSHVQTMDDAPILPGMQELYEMNSDTVGWLTIDDTVIDYVVMQTPADEDYYLDRDFQKNYSAYGSLIMDTDSQIGSGTKENEYADGSIPCTNLIIHGHNMKNGSMFGNLDLYKQESYGKEHNIIKFSSLYEEREYEICAVFLSQVYLKTQTDVFKYYKFFQADTEEEFKDYYDNIKKMSLYDTGVEAEFGDEFITLSVCAYHVENGRLVVVGKRIK